ncbi:universal stress protein [Streptomyces sp. NBC_00879]|uniref:universal stress protein n=1 Tax=unclassified Streptomyces TaxID=2593676 RepID=UPI00386939B3|nr:universal stress protein [Streptomyces sp. NBC_00885]WSY78769.1 universal stress protein [Streptomyces sp. NBC_00879]
MGSSTAAEPELGTVVVGVDGSANAATAADWAAAEADRRGRPLRLLYAADTYRRALYASVETVERVRQRGRDVLKDTADRLAEQYPELQINKELSPREPTVSLLDAAGSDGTIVVGNRGYGGFAALLLGSVGLRVAAGATVPVVVVRGAAQGAGAGVVVAAVRDEDDLDCVRHAARAAELRKASLRLLSVWQVLRYVGMVATMLDDVDEIAQQHLHRVSTLADRIRDEFPELTVTADVEEGASVAGTLVEASRQADLLVMGGRRPPDAFGPTLGRVTHAVLHHAECPVELIPRESKRHREEQ